MRIHLISFATPRFRMRQILLGLSARVNRIADTVTAFSPESLRKAGFQERMKGISLAERGSGFWAWKPFLIDRKLAEVPEGDIVFYCDVGRLYPFKLLHQPVTPFVHWMTANRQQMMPGVRIPWSGPNGQWIKREALVDLGMDRPEVHLASPVQASFSLWKVGPESRSFVSEWLDLCSRRELVSDDPSRAGLVELPEFRGHRHDQALLSLLCMRHGLKAMELGEEHPGFDTRHPSLVSKSRFGRKTGCPSFVGKTLRIIAWPVEKAEEMIRGNIRFGKPINE